jgi:hypothetical protein
MSCRRFIRLADGYPLRANVAGVGKMGLNKLESLEGKIKTPENNLSFSESLQLAELRLLQWVVFWVLSLITVALLSVIAMAAYNVSQGKDISQGARVVKHIQRGAKLLRWNDRTRSIAVPEFPPRNFVNSYACLRST